MASKTTLNAKNLETLGAERLAVLLIEISTGSAVAKRRLRLELAGAQSPKEAGREVAKRLSSLARARSRVNWRNRKALLTDLESQLTAIRDQIAPTDPAEAMSLTWRFLQIAGPLLQRTDDSSGVFMELFRTAGALLGDLALAAQTPPKTLADAAFVALQDNEHGQYDALIRILAPALGGEGLAQLKAQIEALAATPLAGAPPEAGQAGRARRTGASYQHQAAERARQGMVRSALKDLADVMGDVDAFIAQYDPEARKIPQIAAQIAARLLAAGRAGEALACLDHAAGRDAASSEAWQAARIEALEALGQPDAAQAFRLESFRANLSTGHLRQYLRRLADFDDLEAEEAAMDHVLGHANVEAALQFFLEWPALERAAQLVEERFTKLDGDRYDLLTPAAEALAPRYPLAATLALRAMIDFTLKTGRSSRYQHAARHLADCAALSADVEDFKSFEPHRAYLDRLRRDHARKAGFWSQFL